MEGTQTLTNVSTASLYLCDFCFIHLSQGKNEACNYLYLSLANECGKVGEKTLYLPETHKLSEAVSGSVRINFLVLGNVINISVVTANNVRFKNKYQIYFLFGNVLNFGFYQYI